MCRSEKTHEKNEIKSSSNRTLLENGATTFIRYKEAVEILQGRGCPRLRSLCVALATQMLCLCHGWEEENSRRQVEAVIADGRAFRQMQAWVAAQGGDPSYLTEPTKFPAATAYSVTATTTGYITAMDAARIGSVGVLLGGGRQTKEDVIDHAAGIRIHKKTGDKVQPGDVIATLYTNRPSMVEQATEGYLTALTFGDTAPEEKPLIYTIVQ